MVVGAALTYLGLFIGQRRRRRRFNCLCPRRRFVGVGQPKSWPTAATTVVQQVVLVN